MLPYDTSANHCSDRSGNDHTCNQSDRPPRPKNFRCLQDVVLTTVGHCLIRHCFSSNRIRNDSASESGKHLIDDVADSQCFSVAVAYLPEQQLCDNAGEDEEYDIRQISAHNSADDAVNENCAGLFHLCADYEVDDALKQRDKLDSSREVAPLVPAEDAVHVDSTAHTIDEVVRIIEGLINQRR